LRHQIFGQHKGPRSVRLDKPFHNPPRPDSKLARKARRKVRFFPATASLEREETKACPEPFQVTKSTGARNVHRMRHAQFSIQQSDRN
jgi:hypothetical protein